MVYDSARKRTVMFGGWGGGCGCCAYTWEYYVPTLASYSAFGKGCGSSAIPTTLSATTLPKINTTFNLRVSNLAPFTVGILLFGISDTTWNGTPLPLDLSFLGMKGCNLLVSWEMQDGPFAAPVRRLLS